MHVHLVFETKRRHKVFTDRHLTPMEQITRDVCANFEAELIEFNGENNHVLVNSLKDVSSHRLQQESPDPIRHYYQANRLVRRRPRQRRTAERHKAALHS
ncbi:transposase [Micromonospora arborensis]|uniref:transposase n=1 Tax=Micromonospora arborensis TaxID=2116518 RepID=UPI0033E2452B